MVFVCLKAQRLEYLAAVAAVVFEGTNMIDVDILGVFLTVNT